MVSYPGYEKIIKRIYEYNQEHVFAYWEELEDSEKVELLEELGKIDFKMLKDLFRQTKQKEAAALDFVPSRYIPVPKTADDKKRFLQAREAGIRHIKNGKVAAFVVAGGQGTRLGFDGPKGIFCVGPVSNKSLFQIHAEKILKYSKKYGVPIPWLIMTSEENHDDTYAYLCEHHYFGIKESDVILFSQNMIPSLDVKGRLVLEHRGSIFKNPDGHGGSLTALASSGALSEMKKRGIETISYFQIDNPLVNIIDPVFVGFHVQNNADISSKGVQKAYPEEKVGVFVEFSNKTTGVVEYSDLPAEMQNARDPDGNLKYCMGSIAIHLFNLDYIRSITGSSKATLPFHVAKKKISSYTENGHKEIEGYKFEKFVFDALPLSGKNILLEVKREDEFAPVKNSSGVDSVESARRLMSELSRRWLAERGVTIPKNVESVEISPLFAVEPDDIKPSTILPDEKMVYLE